MPSVTFDYENNKFNFEYDPDRFEVIGNDSAQPLSDIQIGNLLDSPIGSPPLEEIIKDGDTVLFIIPDATRKSGAGAIINLVVRRLIANGTMPYDMAIMFATENRPQVTEAEKESILTQFIAQRLVSFSHNHRDLTRLAVIDANSEIGRVTLNRALKEYTHVVSIADVSFDIFAGFTGGPELLCPGAAASESIKQINKIKSDTTYKNLKDAAISTINSTNPVLAAIAKFTESISHTFSIHTTVNEKGELTELVCGDSLESFIFACKEYLSRHLLRVEGRRDVVVVRGGGWANQQATAISSAADVCEKGGIIYLLTDSFDAFLADKIYTGLITDITKTHRLKIVTDIECKYTAEYGIEQVLTSELKNKTAEQKGYIIPYGGKNIFETNSQ